MQVLLSCVGAQNKDAQDHDGGREHANDENRKSLHVRRPLDQAPDRLGDDEGRDGQQGCGVDEGDDGRALECSPTRSLIATAPMPRAIAALSAM